MYTAYSSVKIPNSLPLMLCCKEMKKEIGRYNFAVIKYILSKALLFMLLDLCFLKLTA